MKLTHETDNFITENVKRETEIAFDKYKKTMGSIFAVLFMIIFSNKKLDVPLTNDIQDLLTGIVKEDKSFLMSLSDVKENRKEMIKNWFKNKISIFVKTRKAAVDTIEVVKKDLSEEKTEDKS